MEIIFFGYVLRTSLITGEVAEANAEEMTTDIGNKDKNHII